MTKRIFDIIFSCLALLLFSPLLFLIFLLVAITSKGSALYLQNRVGKNNFDFKLIKFRTMKVNSDIKGLLTIGGNDSRITSVGYYLRKYKLDELPQLINVLLGSMSLVGPRPEVRKYVDMYTDSQKEILNIKPGITDYASLEYFNENQLLANSSDPEKTYIEEVMPAKIELNKKYIAEIGLFTDLKIIILTVKKIFSN